MKFICQKHGEVEAEPNFNLDVYCPLCVDEAVADWLEDTIPPMSAPSDAARTLVRPASPSGLLDR